MKKIKQHLYTYEDYRFQRGEIRLVTLPNGRLFANGRYPTNMTADDLPEWYIHGRYYKRWGYLSAKGITDMIYIPNLWVNHFLRDDCLLIAYGGKINPNPEYSEHNLWCEKYIGWDERVWGTEILDILKGAEKFSGYDISSFGPQMKEKLQILKDKYPEEFGNYSFDVDEWLAESN